MKKTALETLRNKYKYKFPLLFKIANIVNKREFRYISKRHFKVARKIFTAL